MYLLRRFHGHRFDRLNAIIDSLGGHISSYVNLIGSGTLPLPEVCRMEGLPGTACRVEGHRGQRFFPGTGPFDEAEELIEEGVRSLFGLDESYAVSGQPHSATQANHAVFLAVLGDSAAAAAALDPVDGGHISHRFGLPQPAPFVPFPLTDALIDYDRLEEIVIERDPAILVAGGTSYAREISYRRLRSIADRVGAHLHADLAHTAPFVATGLHGPAFPFCDSVTLDTSKGLRGPRGGILVWRDGTIAKMRRAIFPLLQSSPNQNGLLAKAACTLHWTKEDLRPYAERMVRLARVLGESLEPALGPPVSGGTDTHLLSFDVTSLGTDGLRAEEKLAAGRILVNRNQVPGDPKGPLAPSGIRLGSTVLAILAYDEADTRSLGDAITSILLGEGEYDETVERLLEAHHRPLVSTASE
jgi:glycine hydroxymethyltransferase